MTRIFRSLALTLALMALASNAAAAALQIPISSPLPGLTAVQDTNAIAASLAAANAGSTAPTTTSTGLSSTAGVLWHDTSTNTLKIRDQADSAWIVVGFFDETNKLFTPHVEPGAAYAADTGSANAYVVAQAVTPDSLVAGVTALFTSSHANTGSSTLNLDGFGVQNITHRDGTPLIGGEIVAGSVNLVVYDGTNFQLLSSGGASGAAVVRGAASGLKLSAAGGGATVTIAANSATLTDTYNNGYLASAVSTTPSLSTAGAGGLDSGTATSNTWYAVYLINDGGTIKGLFSLSATAPTMPSGDTYRARVGWVRTDGSGNIRAFVQYGNHARWVNTGSGLQQIASGSAGSPTTPTWVGLAVGAFAPSTASAIDVTIWSYSTAVVAAPDSSYGDYQASTNPPPLLVVAGGQWMVESGSLALESSNIYWASGSSNGAIYAAGWSDNL